ncbi:TrmH family RNA methyltransferase [Amaricoccus tamworthensis]|uniref:TrmH family RNA methyltransferase n=1 Tax=Amaricoccus tamworthensis TaxID=57002 RepID=UPI003C797D62
MDSDDTKKKSKPSVRKRAEAIRAFRCKHLVAVIEDPGDFRNIASVIRNANALGVEKVYVVDPGKRLPDDWQEMRERRSLTKRSVSAIKWTFVKRFDSTAECFDHLERKNFTSIVTSPHVKGANNAYLHEGDFTTQSKLAVWFGNETRGISPEAVARSELCVAIPMFGMIESLNLGTCSGIVLYEITKQRREYQARYRFRNKKGRRPVELPTLMNREA